MTVSDSTKAAKGRGIALFAKCSDKSMARGGKKFFARLKEGRFNY